jgi:phage tail-like protein
VSVVISGLTGVTGDSDMPKLLFNSFTPPSWSTETPKHKFYGGNSNIEIVHGGARNENWSPAQLGRGVDVNHTLFQWVQQIREKGPNGAKTDVSITVQAEAGTPPICVWHGTGAVITGFSHGASNASSNEVLTESVTIDAEHWDLMTGGGQAVAAASVSPGGGGGGGGGGGP